MVYHSFSQLFLFISVYYILFSDLFNNNNNNNNNYMPVNLICTTVRSFHGSDANYVLPLFVPPSNAFVALVHSRLIYLTLILLLPQMRGDCIIDLYFYCFKLFYFCCCTIVVIVAISFFYYKNNKL